MSTQLTRPKPVEKLGRQVLRVPELSQRHCKGCTFYDERGRDVKPEAYDSQIGCVVNAEQSCFDEDSTKRARQGVIYIRPNGWAAYIKRRTIIAFNGDES